MVASNYNTMIMKKRTHDLDKCPTAQQEWRQIFSLGGV